MCLYHVVEVLSIFPLYPLSGGLWSAWHRVAAVPLDLTLGFRQEEEERVSQSVSFEKVS